MKKIIVTSLALVLLIGTTIAQGFNAGIKVSANLNKVSGQSFQDGYDLGYQGGFFAEIDFSKDWGIQPEVLFNQVNTKRASGFNALYTNLYNPFSSENITLNYLSIPVLLRYNISKFVTLNAGPQYSILIDDNENLLKNGENAFKKGDFSVVGGLSVNFMKFRVYGRYNIGLTNINDIDDKEKWKNQQLQLGVGLRF